MSIYIRFNKDGIQVEAAVLSEKPDGWHEVPANFNWEKHYRILEDGTIVEHDKKSELLSNAKLAALDRVRSILNNHRRKYAGYSHEKSRSYDIQAKAAESILNGNQSDIDLIKPLADIRSISVIEMARLIKTKAEESIRAIARSEALEDQAQKAIKEAKTQEELDSLINEAMQND